MTPKPTPSGAAAVRVAVLVPESAVPKTVRVVPLGARRTVSAGRTLTRYLRDLGTSQYWASSVSPATRPAVR